MASVEPQVSTCSSQVPPNGPPGFLNDYTLSDLESPSQTAASPEPMCEQCEENNKAVSHCATCSDYLCEECLKAHRRLKAYRNHKTVRVSDVPTKHQPVTERKRVAKKWYHCSIHPGERLKLYCKTCQSLACLHCFVAYHNGHNIGNIDTTTRKKVERQIKYLARESDLKLKEFEENLQYISAVERDKTEASASLKVEINKTIDSLIAQLETRRTQLINDVESSFTKDLKELWAQKEYHETAIVSLKGALSFARRSLVCKEDTELLALCFQVTSRLKQLSQLTWDSQSTERVEMTKMELKTVPLASKRGKQVYQSGDVKLVGEIHRTLSQPMLEIAAHNVPSVVEVNSETKFQVTAAIMINGKNVCNRAREGVKITGTATCKYYNSYHGSLQNSLHSFPSRGTRLSVTVEQGTNEDSWMVTFTPSYSGTYSICLEARGQYGQVSMKNSYKCDVQVTPV